MDNFDPERCLIFFEGILGQFEEGEIVNSGTYEETMPHETLFIVPGMVQD
ncbi:hypothetical protein [Paenibacillus sp. R14(2021)]|nr:hypothetical protein [Paenibacillus sp. R14(2021)]